MVNWPESLDLGAALVVGVVSAGGTFLVRLAARRYGFVAKPNQRRWHRTPTALLGGVAIFAAFVFGFLVFVPREPGHWMLMACATAMFLVGLADDLIGVKPYTKLLAQIVIATLLLAFGATIPFSSSEPLNLLIMLTWLVGITNAMNLLDNMDGLCAGIAVIAGLFRLLFCALEGHPAGVATALVFIAAVAGFLLFNFNPASIFMGDSGSLFIGFLLAGLSVSAMHSNAARSMFAVLFFPVLSLAIPIFDTTLVTITRHFSGRPISEGGRDHSSHRLVAIGQSETRAVGILWGMSALGGGIAFLFYRYGIPDSVLIAILFGVGLVLFGVYLGKATVQIEGTTGRVRPANWLLAARSASRRRVFMVALDVLLVATAYYGAYWLRFDGFSKEPEQFPLLLDSMPVALLCALTSFLFFGLYRNHWRYTGIRDLWMTLKATSTAVLLTVAASTLLYRFEGYSRSVFLIYWGSLFLFVSGSRCSFRLFAELLEGRPPDQARVLIYGAGDNGELLLRELKGKLKDGRRVVGFLDDDPAWARTLIHGVPVLGGSETAEDWIRKHSVGEIILSSNEVPQETIARLRAVCEKSDIELTRATMTIKPEN